MRNSMLKEVRSQWKESRFFYGKNRVMQLALGRTEAEEYKEGLHNIAQVQSVYHTREAYDCAHVQHHVGFDLGGSILKLG